MTIVSDPHYRCSKIFSQNTQKREGMVLPYLFVTTEEYHGNGQADNLATYSYTAICNDIKHVCQLEHLFDLYVGFLRPKRVQFNDIMYLPAERQEVYCIRIHSGQVYILRVCIVSLETSKLCQSDRKICVVSLDCTIQKCHKKETTA